MQVIATTLEELDSLLIYKISRRRASGPMHAVAVDEWGKTDEPR